MHQNPFHFQGCSSTLSEIYDVKIKSHAPIHFFQIANSFVFHQSFQITQHPCFFSSFTPNLTHVKTTKIFACVLPHAKTQKHMIHDQTPRTTNFSGS
jgi:hypothetical protein